MKEINVIKEFLYLKIISMQKEQKKYNIDNNEQISDYFTQLDNANKVAAKLQGAIDLFKDIEKL
jgi:CRISPR/Cas system-associated endonuclease Cas1